VSRASVTVGDEIVAHIGHGFVALVGVAAGDGPADLEYTATKIAEVRVFADERGRLNKSVRDVQGAVLIVSQFTLLGDVRNGRRPAFDTAASADEARHLYDDLVARLRALELPVEAGRFQTHMQVELVNDGPVTILLDSRRTF
jgi:D-tyrosyl-tRNA(Tyr) deacylase